MANLMHGLEITNKKNASLQMQFFWKYIRRLKSKGKLSYSSYGDTDTAPDPNDYINFNAAKSDAGEVGAQSRLAFQQTMTFFNALTELEAVLRDLVFDFISKQRMHKREHIDFSNIAKHLGQAVYLDNDVIMFERMPANQMLLKISEHDIVGMVAFVLRAIYRELLFWDESHKNWKLPNDATPLIEAFEDKFHIAYDAELFADWGWSAAPNDTTNSAQLREQLKGVLTDIDEQTPFKSPDYEDYYDALHGVLFDGDCSLESLMPAYHQAWEELCVYHAVHIKNLPVCYIDTEALTTIDLKTCCLKEVPEKAFKFNGKQRRPDLVCFRNQKYTVIDFKHYDVGIILPNERFKLSSGESDFYKKVASDFDSMDGYMLLLANHLRVDKEDIAHAFWMPKKDSSSTFPNPMKRELIDIEATMNQYVENSANTV